MTLLVTVLQLDTDFPRIAGDVGCKESYARPPQIIRVKGASVGRIVTDRPQDIDIAPSRRRWQKPLVISSSPPAGFCPIGSNTLQP